MRQRAMPEVTQGMMISRPRKKVALRLDFEPMIGALTEKTRNIGLLHEAETARHTPEAFAEAFDLDTTAWRHPGLIFGSQSHKYDTLMDGIVVL